MYINIKDDECSHSNKSQNFGLKSLSLFLRFLKFMYYHEGRDLNQDQL